jgi:hypothetical protein
MITFDPFDERISFPKETASFNTLLLSGNSVFLHHEQ